MRSFQIVLCRCWDFQNEEDLILWTPQCREDLVWWTSGDRLVLGRDIRSVPADHMFWSDTSDQGWGAHLGSEIASGLWSQEDQAMSINWRELKAIRLGILSFQDLVAGSVVAVFTDSTTAIAYLRH